MCYYTHTQVNDGGSLCGTTRWKAAKAVSKTMELAGCRHGLGLKGLNVLWRDESYIYMVFTFIRYNVC